MLQSKPVPNIKRGDRVVSGKIHHPGTVTLDAYEMYMQSFSTSQVGHGTDRTELDMSFVCYDYRAGPAYTEQESGMPEFFKDLNFMNTLRKSKHPGVIEQWEKLQVLVELSNNTNT